MMFVRNVMTCYIFLRVDVLVNSDSNVLNFPLKCVFCHSFVIQRCLKYSGNSYTQKIFYSVHQGEIKNVPTITVIE